MPNTASASGAAQAWSLFPSIEMNAMQQTVMVQASPSSQILSEDHALSKPLSATPHNIQGMASPPKDIPLFRPSQPSSRIKLPFGNPRSIVPKIFENTKPTPPASQSLPADSALPIRTSSKSRDEHQELPEPRNVAATMTSSVHSPSVAHSRSVSPDSVRTAASSFTTSLPALQQKGVEDKLEPLVEEELDPGSFDLVAPPGAELPQYSLETRSKQLFSTEHLQTIFDDPSLLVKFTSFMSKCRPSSIPVLIYYLDAIKALKALAYSNAIMEALEPIRDFDFTLTTAKRSANSDLEEKAKLAFDVLVREDLPAYITHTYVQTVSLSIQMRITGTLPVHLQEASEGLAEVFCLTDPSRPDNPIVFASEEFNRTTQYGMGYILGRNCRFLQGPNTDKNSVRRLRETILGGKEHCEVFLNYRRDGSPFMNLLMTAPLCDSRGVIRYFIGAQVDVSGLVKECSDLESLQRIAIKSDHRRTMSETTDVDPEILPPKDEFQELSEMLNNQELDTVRRYGGTMHKEPQVESKDSSQGSNWNKPRLLINSVSPDGFRDAARASGKLSGIYENYLLVRSYPSLRILFASPSLRVPGILQSPFMDKIGGSARVRDELTRALAEGRGVTARVRWVSKKDPEGYNRWIHCTPLLGGNGAVGVWMIVLVDEETQPANAKRFRLAPPIDARIRRRGSFGERKDTSNVKDFALMPDRPSSPAVSVANSARGSADGDGSLRSFNMATERSGSPYTLRI